MKFAAMTLAAIAIVFGLVVFVTSGVGLSAGGGAAHLAVTSLGLETQADTALALAAGGEIPSAMPSAGGGAGFFVAGIVPLLAVCGALGLGLLRE